MFAEGTTVFIVMLFLLTDTIFYTLKTQRSGSLIIFCYSTIENQSSNGSENGKRNCSNLKKADVIKNIGFKKDETLPFHLHSDKILTDLYKF